MWITHKERQQVFFRSALVFPYLWPQACGGGWERGAFSGSRERLWGSIPGTYALQAVLALHRLHAAGADAVAELLQMLLYLTNFPRKKNGDGIPSQCSAAVRIITIYLLFYFFIAFCKHFWIEVKILKESK